jgi:hypothetical protein
MVFLAVVFGCVQEDVEKTAMKETGVTLSEGR